MADQVESGFLEFVSNYTDKSTDRGFQFEVHCGRCSSGYRTPFKPWAVGTASSVLDTANSLFGGVFGKAADVGERVRSGAWQRAHDEAFKDALQGLRPQFIQCPRCSSWVCRKSCWNERRGLCKSCAPDVGVEMSAAQASRTVEEVWAHAAMAEEDKKLGEANWRQTIRASCPNCESPLDGNVKFCPECGAKLQVQTHCPQCKAKVAPTAKFCPECGQSMK
jgi:hypothetical protein